MKDCLFQCQRQGFEDAHMFSNVSDTILSSMQQRKPYAYLHLCYYQMNALHKAASAAYTYLTANPEDERMKRNVEYYIEQPEVNIKEVNDLESEDYQTLYKLGKQAYGKNKWGETIANMEETLTDYLTWENFCRAECEHQSEQEWSPEFMISISNNILPVLVCRQECQNKLKPLYTSGVEFLADLLNYLQISYYRMDRLEDAAKGVASYLSLLPDDEDMLANMNIYKTLVDNKKFVERSDIVHYLKRDKRVMASEVIEDKLTIKNILFTKALPNYIIPIAPDGHKIFPCTDCGDKFLLESSYNFHINRKSLKITYLCRYCNKVLIFNNRCKLLSHIRSHAFKTATINVSDLKLEPLSIQEINWTTTNPSIINDFQQKHKKNNICFECDEVIDSTGAIQKDRAKHYMRYTSKVYMCPICLFTVPNTCILAAHLRIHLKMSPYFCPECGIHLSAKSIEYPYYHDCEGFKMIRATTRLQCRQKSCNKVFHPNEYRDHLKTHIKKIYKCIKCSAVWFNERPKKRHSPCTFGEDKIALLFQCQICPNKFIPKGESNYMHLNKHFKTTTEQNRDQVYPCMICNVTFNVIPQLIKHQIDSHGACKETLSKFMNEPESKGNPKGIYRVVKRCDKCLRSFIYRCQLENIKILPNECPYKCSISSSKENNISELTKENNIVCGLCKQNINEKWENIKIHFAKFHKSHKCLDLNLTVCKMKIMTPVINNINKNNKVKFKNKRKYIKTKQSYDNNTYVHQESKNHPQRVPGEKNRCSMCDFTSEDDENYEKHIITHRDPCMAYQCLECGRCFAVKPSFSTHLLLEHNIANVKEYISTKKCFNELALSTQINSLKKVDEPVNENQCKICRDQFENSHDLEKHFRVHGMAFLMKNKNNSP
ncbi:unnamed protein product, partial [Brenthis ino]